jgi:hypothetical protein
VLGPRSVEVRCGVWGPSDATALAIADAYSELDTGAANWTDWTLSCPMLRCRSANPVHAASSGGQSASRSTQTRLTLRDKAVDLKQRLCTVGFGP